MTFNEIYRDILNFAPNVPALDAMKLINNAISELNSHNFVQEWEMKFPLYTYLTPPMIDLTDVYIGYNDTYTTPIIKVKNVLDQDNYALSRVGAGKEYIENVASDGEKVYGQVADRIYINDTTGGSYTLTFDKVAGTIVDDGGADWTTDGGFSEGDYIIIAGDAVDSSNTGMYLIETISTSTITVDATVKAVGKTEASKATTYALPLYKIIAYIAIPTFSWNSGSPSIDVEVKESYVPAIRHLVLSTVYDVDKYNMKTPVLHEYHKNQADNEISLLESNATQFKEQRVYKRGSRQESEEK